MQQPRVLVLVSLVFALSPGLNGPADASEPSCFGMAATIVGTEGPDRLIGTEGPDVIVGLDGADEIEGRGGNDRICGGDNPTEAACRVIPDVGPSCEPQEDWITGDKGNDKIHGGPGPDALMGGGGDDVLALDIGSGSSGCIPQCLAQVAIGGGGNDLLRGGPASDRLYGQAGEDLLLGRAGDDVLRGGRHPDLINGGEGHDQCESPAVAPRATSCEALATNPG